MRTPRPAGVPTKQVLQAPECCPGCPAGRTVCLSVGVASGLQASTSCVQRLHLLSPHSPNTCIYNKFRTMCPQTLNGPRQVPPAARVGRSHVWGPASGCLPRVGEQEDLALLCPLGPAPWPLVLGGTTVTRPDPSLSRDTAVVSPSPGPTEGRGDRPPGARAVGLRRSWQGRSGTLLSQEQGSFPGLSGPLPRQWAGTRLGSSCWACLSISGALTQDSDLGWNPTCQPRSALW